MKKIIKNNLKTIFTVLLSVIVSSSIAVFATIQVNANQINYNTTTVADALDSMYNTMFSNNYSTTEKVVGKWIDGKPLYQKTIVFNFTSYSSDQFTGDLNIENLDKVCRAEVYHSYNNGKGIESARYGYDDYYFSWYISNNRVTVANRISNVSTFSYIVNVQYTKTTD